jgi:predicted nucleic acid-binding protein
MPAYTLQNMTEFWNASTRPFEKNGFGLTIEETERNARDIERDFTFFPDTEAVYREWRKIVAQNRVAGVKVHDARLAAAMHAHGIADILTFNISDFARFTGITAIDPYSI